MFIGLESLTRAAFKYIIILGDTVPTWIPVPLLRTDPSMGIPYPYHGYELTLLRLTILYQSQCSEILARSVKVFVKLGIPYP